MMEILRGNILVLTSLAMLIAYFFIWCKLDDSGLRARFCFYRRKNLLCMVKRGLCLSLLCAVAAALIHGLLCFFLKAPGITPAGVCYLFLLYITVSAALTMVLAGRGVIAVLALVVGLFVFFFVIVLLILVAQLSLDRHMAVLAVVMFLAVACFGLNTYCGYRRWDVQ